MGSDHPLSPINADGSDRKFQRLIYKGRRAVRIIPHASETGLNEALSFFKIGSHLFKARIPVPEILEFDPVSGIVIVEDLGDRLLHAAIEELKGRNRTSEILEIYKDAVALLREFQKRGTRGFDTAWCFDTSRYNGRFAWEREAVYFLDSFLIKECDIRASAGIMEELQWLCSTVDDPCQEPCLMHRDFQSRNLMVIDGSMKIIDFQGARIGPWGYDLASLLYDPYTDLPEGAREELLGVYLSRYMPESSCTREKMLQAFYITALLRNLQVLGAFSFLSREKGKEFFSAYIHPALHNLQTLLAGKYFKRMRNLRTLVLSLTDR